MTGHETLVEFLMSPRCRLNREAFLHPLPSPTSELRALLGMSRASRDGMSKGRRISWRHKPSSLAMHHHFRNASHRRCHDGQSSCHSFGNGDTESLSERRLNQKGKSMKELSHIAMLAGEHHIIE